MSNIFSKYRKELAGMKVLPLEKVVDKKTGKLKDYDYVGKVSTRLAHVVCKVTKSPGKTTYIEDFSALPKIAKSKIVDQLQNKDKNGEKQGVVFLVRGDKKSKKPYRESTRAKPVKAVKTLKTYHKIKNPERGERK